MNNFVEIKEKAQKKWDSLQNSQIPVIYLGAASCGRAAGAMEVLDSINETLKDNKLKAKIVQVGCIGPCYLEPLMDIAIKGSPRISYANVTPKKARRILESYLIKEDPLSKFAVGHFGDTTEETTNGIPRFFDLPMLKPQIRVVLRNCGFIESEEIDHYIANGGYEGVINSFSKGPEGVISEVKEAGLRGRGGAGFPTYKKWEICRNNTGEKKYMICNADEGDPGAFMNRSLIEGDPHALLEGLLIAAYAIGASQGYIYIRAEYPLAITRLKKAISQMRDYGFLGKNIQNSGFDFDITIKEGAGAFVCGEETALIASIEGKRGMPKARPPYPSVSGLHGMPTVINNVETLATLPNILRKGASWYKQFGVEGNNGTKTFSLVGKVIRTGLIEVPLGMTLRQIIFDIGGGTKKPFKAVQTGGPSGGCLAEKFLDTPIDYESLCEAGSIMGSGGLIIMDSDTCIVDIARYFLNFTQEESCGKCTPCRVGTRHLVEILERITKGEGNPDDIEKLEQFGEAIKNGSLCGLGQSAPNPVLTTIRYFKSEYLKHIKEKQCPAAVCNKLFEYTIIPEKCTGCRLCVKECPTNAITGLKAEPHVLDPDKCIKCRACYEICPFDAIVGKRLMAHAIKENVDV
jgi:NADH:ubiquinone oxidoreductase subunit F (NADH-binding)/(2Fe-2S) ferredoxin